MKKLNRILFNPALCGIFYKIIKIIVYIKTFNVEIHIDLCYNNEKYFFGGEVMIILITGASHIGKTLLAQRILEKYKFPYLSIDHLKMGLIRSRNTDLTPLSDDNSLTDYLWPIVREIIKTAIENNQNLVVEGCYIPFCWKADFTQEYTEKIKFVCLVMSKDYIENHFSDILKFSNGIENRLDDSDICKNQLILENEENLRICKENDLKYILIDKEYNINFEELIYE